MTQDRRKKLKIRAWRRGFREADLILGPFADLNLPGFDEGELDQFETLLDQPDQDVYGWIVEREPTPAAFDNPIMDRLKAFRFQAREIRGDDLGG